jgi:hypothetical protein
MAERVLLRKSDQHLCRNLTKYQCIKLTQQIPIKLIQYLCIKLKTFVHISKETTSEAEEERQTGIGRIKASDKRCCPRFCLKIHENTEVEIRDLLHI